MLETQVLSFLLREPGEAFRISNADLQSKKDEPIAVQALGAADPGEDFRELTLPGNFRIVQSTSDSAETGSYSSPAEVRAPSWPESIATAAESLGNAMISAGAIAFLSGLVGSDGALVLLGLGTLSVSALFKCYAKRPTAVERLETEPGEHESRAA